MRDPWPAPWVLSEATRPVTDILHLKALPPHIHEILLSFTFYTVVDTFVSPRFSAYFFPKHYLKLSLRTKINWNLHFTGFINALILCGGLFFIILFDEERLHGTWEERMWAYSGASSAILAIATGYFMWDFIVCLVHYKTIGMLDLLHGTVGVIATFLMFRPFAMYYAVSYLCFELSTPFVHLHWLFDKLDMTGSPAQWYNGVVLIIVFFCCRILLGPYLSWVYFCDIRTAARYGIYTTHILFPQNIIPTTMEHNVPTWAVVFFLIANATLMSLNFFWFSKMIEAVRKRFREPRTEAKPSSYSAKVNDRAKKG